MWFFAVAVLHLLHLIHCQTYDDLAKDDCFKKIYVCGDFRSRVTGPDGQLLTNPRDFVGRCKANKEFMACIDDAATFCKGKLHDFSKMVLDNRKSLKTICSEPAWGQKYINSAPCINKNLKKLSRECRREVRLQPDGRPWWCLIPEPCDAIERVFTCTIQKIENTCGPQSGEIYKKIQILKVQNQDVVCEFRRRNPSYCKHDRVISSNRPKRDASTDGHSTQTFGISTLDSVQSAVSEAISNVAKAVTINIIESVVKTVESSAVKHEDEKCFNETLGKFFKEVDLLKSHVIVDDDCQKLITSKEINSKFSLTSDCMSYKTKSYSPVLLENTLNSVCLGKITDQCFLMAKNMWKIAKMNEASEISMDSSKVVEHLQTALAKLQEILEDEEMAIDQADHEHFTIYFNSLKNVALKELNCSLVSGGVLKCIINLESGCSEMSEMESGPEDLNSESDNSNDSYQKLLVMESTESESEYLVDLMTESCTDTTESSTLDTADVLKDSPPEAEDRSGDILKDTLNVIENEQSDDSQPPLETLDLKENDSVSLMETTTEFSILNTDKSYILMGDPYHPTEASTVYLAMGSEEDTTTQVYLVSPETILTQLDSSIEEETSEAEVLTEASTGSGEQNKIDDLPDSEGSKTMEDMQQQKLEEALSEILEVSDTAHRKTPELNENISEQKRKNPKDKIHDHMDEPFVKIEFGDMPSYKTMSVNGLADIYSGDSENLNELLQKLKFEVTEEPRKEMDGTAEELASTDKSEKEPSTSFYITEPTVTGRVDL